MDLSGNLIIADSNNGRLRKVDKSGVITTVAGNGTGAYGGDNGPATSAAIKSPLGAVFDTSGNMCIADYSNHLVRKVDQNGTITTYAGTGGYGYSGDNGPATAAQFSQITGLAFDTSGILFIVDKDNHVIRKINQSGIVTTVVGNGIPDYTGDNGPATNASLHWPYQIAFDSSGNMYIADSENSTVRMVNTSNIITTYAGTGTSGYIGDNGPATSAELYYPEAITVDNFGNIFICDTYNHVSRKINASGVITTVAGNCTAGFSGDNGPATFYASFFVPTRYTTICNIGCIMTSFS